MSPEKQRLALAELCPRIFNEAEDSDYWIWQGEGDGDKWHHCHNNDPLQDLNAIREAEKVLNDLQKRYFVNHLHTICVDRPAEEAGFDLSYANELELIFFGFHATAAQRAEAFLRALGKWKA